MKNLKYTIGALLVGLSSSFMVSCDDDETTTPSTVAFFSDAYDAPEEGGSVTLGFQLDKPAVEDVTVTLSTSGSATAGEDFTLEESSVVVPAGETNGSFTINVINDLADDDNETIDVGISAAGLSTSGSYLVTIKDDDCPFTYVGAFGGDDVHINGRGLNIQYGADVTIAAGGASGHTLEGLNVEFMEDFWGEEVIEQVAVEITIDGAGNITIPEQHIFTTLYNGTEYPYDIVGTGKINTCDGTISIDYDVIQDGFAVGAWAHTNSYMTDLIFHAELTPL
jgi:hypothetical protein